MFMEKYRWSEEIFEKLRSDIMAALDLSREQNDEEIYRFIETEVEEYSKNNLLTLKEREQLEHLLFNSLRKYDAIQELLEDADVTEIMINGASNIFYEKKGKLFQAQTHFSSEQKLSDVIQQMAGNSNRMVNEASPIVDTRLADGSRVNIVLSPISIDGAAVSIRKFPKTPILMEDLIRIGSITEEAAAFLKVLVAAGYNIFISGGTGSGKTTFLNALSQYIPREERIITIEDSAELRLVDKPNLVRLETRNQMFDGVKPITIRDLIRTALRMRPERIVVGECRGEEALDMLQAMNTGHDGSLSTGHANSCRDMLSRLETMVLMGMELPLAAIRSQIASGLDILVHLGRMRDKSRKVLAITEVIGMQDGEIVLKDLYRYVEKSPDVEMACGKLQQMGTLFNQEKCKRAGITLTDTGE
ncbi:CpaF family protein [Roseburia sp.]|uniref:CpaF family protein n=1 Tax=Roseburia sp. TaxID=2049040 RepID=UPI0035209483